MKITGFHIVDYEYGQIRSLDELLRVIQYLPKSRTKWMRLNSSNQSAVALVSKRVISDEGIQPHMFHLPSKVVKIVNFV